VFDFCHTCSLLHFINYIANLSYSLRPLLSIIIRMYRSSNFIANRTRSRCSSEFSYLNRHTMSCRARSIIIRMYQSINFYQSLASNLPHFTKFWQETGHGVGVALNLVTWIGTPCRQFSFAISVTLPLTIMNGAVICNSNMGNQPEFVWANWLSPLTSFAKTKSRYFGIKLGQIYSKETWSDFFESQICGKVCWCKNLSVQDRHSSNTNIQFAAP
jgi:hypothetical protein